MKSTKEALAAMRRMLDAPEQAPRGTRRAVPAGLDGEARTERLGMKIRASVAARMAAACLYTPGLTLVDLVEMAVEREIGRLEKERGEAFPDAGDQRPKRGRPIRR